MAKGELDKAFGAASRMRMLLAIRQHGVSDARILQAIESVPRELFVETAFIDKALEDIALPIACGQTISQPSVVGIMTQALDPLPSSKILEIGTGSAYQTAILAKLCRRLYTIERHDYLIKVARQRIAELEISNINFRHGDGSLGWPEQAPFSRILLTAACDDPPKKLLDQLAEGGIMVAPVGRSDEMQQIIRIEKHDGELKYHELGDVRFVPMVEGVARDT